MTPLRSAAATISIGTFLIWIYCVIRIFLGEFAWDAEFIDGIPISFLEISIGSFIIFLAAIFSYLVLEDLT
jgi:hypothetical protein